MIVGSEMIERVARSMQLADLKDGDDFDQSWDREKELWMHLAKAALQALMEPTPGMVEAGWAAERPWVHPKDSLAGAYTAMIRSAMEGE